MDENPGLSDQYRMASPWPVFIALGLPIAELGILFGGDFFPVAVGGLLLFFGSVAGMLREAGYVETPWTALGASALLTFLLGVLFIYGGLELVQRGTAIIVAGGIMLAGAVAGRLFLSEKRYA